MRLARFFIEGRHSIGKIIALAPGDARKLVSVLRAKNGDSIELIDSSAHRFYAEIAIDGSNVTASLSRLIERSTSELSCRVDLAQALPKAQKMDFIVEKAIELGAHRILPFVSERCIVRDAPEARITRWQRLARSAAEQSGRDILPEVHSAVPMANLVASFDQYDGVLFAWELAEMSLHAALTGVGAHWRSLLVMIGPEGGFSHDEAHIVTQARAHAVSLGPRILRTETAGLVVLAIVGYAYG